VTVSYSAGDCSSSWGCCSAALGPYLVTSFAEQKQDLLGERQRELAQLNTAVAQQTAGLLKLAETNLRTLDRFLQANPKIDPRTDPQFVALVDMLRRSSNGLIELRMVSTEGGLYFIPSLDGKPLAGVKDRTYFSTHLAPGERKLYFGEPVLSRVTHKWAIPISWRLESPVSGMLVMLAEIELDRVFVLHEKLRLKPYGTIMLVGTTGVVLSRTPYEQSLIGKNLADSLKFKHEYGVKTRGAFITDGSLSEGVHHVATYERLDEYPVIVLVTQPLNEVLAPYYERRDLTFALGTLVTLVLVALTLFLHRFVRALQVAKVDLRHLATIDSLTGMLARRRFLEIAQREFSRAHRYERPTVIAALDIDNFKQVNDTHGHAMGDTVLRECCVAWLTILREQDFLGRVGGEEFCAILPETALDGARSVAERLRQVTAALRFGSGETEFAVTVSIGLAGVTSADEQLGQVMERADQALYAAKNGGRNRVETLEQKRLRAVTAYAVRKT
jgi:diguanylate cyclase (GGDEF)-like protein